MLSDVARDFTAARGVANVYGLLEFEEREQRCDVRSVGVHFVARLGLARAPVTAAVMGDDAKAALEEVEHLIVPIVRAQRPAVMEHQRLCALGSPILVVDQ